MASTPKNEDGLELLWAAHMGELKSMSDADILEGVDLPKFHTDRIQLMASAKSEAGRRRLTAAKEKLEAAKDAPVRALPTVSVSEARAFLRQASNNSEFTMAARALDDLSDETVLRTYAKLKGLDAPDPLGENS